MGTPVQPPMNPTDPMAYAEELRKKREALAQGVGGQPNMAPSPAPTPTPQATPAPPQSDPLSTAKLKMSMGLEGTLTEDEKAALAVNDVQAQQVPAPAAPPAEGQQGMFARLLSMVGLGQ